MTGRDAASSAPSAERQLLGDLDVLGAPDPAADADDQVGLGQVDALVGRLDRSTNVVRRLSSSGGGAQLDALAAAGARGSSCRAAELIANTAGSGVRAVACSCPP